MEHRQAQTGFHAFYRIISIEYTNDDCCMIGVQIADVRTPKKFKLAQHCASFQWLKHFHHPDLETIWQLTKRQNMSAFKRISSYMFLKSLMIRDLLVDWEEEAKGYTLGARRDFEDW